MTDKLTIVINGLEYVAKSNKNNDLYYMNRELLLNDEITKLRNEINDLERDLGLASLENEKKQCIINELDQVIDKHIGEIQGLSLQINDLEQTIAELEEEAGETMSKYNELADALHDINYITSGLI